MSKRTREVWHCDVCGWEWLPDFDKVPDRCPNRKCRKRNWNSPEKPTSIKFSTDGGTNWDNVWSNIKKK